LTQRVTPAIGHITPTAYAITLRDNPELARIPLDAAVDQSLVKSLDREGFFRQLYSAP
jgi:hypothetical protein